MRIRRSREIRRPCTSKGWSTPKVGLMSPGACHTFSPFLIKVSMSKCCTHFPRNPMTSTSSMLNWPLLLVRSFRDTCSARPQAKLHRSPQINPFLHSVHLPFEVFVKVLFALTLRFAHLPQQARSFSKLNANFLLGAAEPEIY